MGLLDQLGSFAQGASNSIAGSVSAPVDGIAWLLRKAGVPLPSNPVGGSDWMAQQGLTAQPKNQIAGLLGEGIGGALPSVAASRAPQIARGLLQGADNLAAPATMNKQAGAIVWHGSPHTFDKFDASKIGDGVGMQAYGHGLYLADSPEVARMYAKNISTPYSDPAASIALKVMNASNDPVSRLKSIYPSMSDADINAAVQTAKSHQGNLYKVDLPDEHIAKMLDWNNPIQPEIHKPVSDAAMQQFGSGLSSNTGENLYKEVVKNFEWAGHPQPQDAATSWLSQNGVPGIRYAEPGKQGIGKGTQNTVLFPGNEGLLNILDRNGIPTQ